LFIYFSYVLANCIIQGKDITKQIKNGLGRNENVVTAIGLKTKSKEPKQLN